jgi:hypothetical protein
MLKRWTAAPTSSCSTTRTSADPQLRQLVAAARSSKRPAASRSTMCVRSPRQASTHLDRAAHALAPSLDISLDVGEG